jgi:hypothetical protein
MATWQHQQQWASDVTATTTGSAPLVDYGSNSARASGLSEQGVMRDLVDGEGPAWSREPAENGWGTGGSQSVLQPGGPVSEMDRQLAWQNPNAEAWKEAHDAAGPIAADLPQPAVDQLGTVDYYVFRAHDFARRHPELPAPDYYLEYGKKYCWRFSEELFPQLSDAGKVWCIKTRMNLQLAIESRLLAGPAAFDALESKPGALRAYAFDTHPQAYLDAGLADLPIADLVRISLTPDMEDLATMAGAIQAARAGLGVAKEWWHDLEEDEGTGTEAQVA